MKASKLTSKYQATVPQEIRKHLRLRAGDAVVFKIEDGRVTLAKATPAEFAYLKGVEQTLTDEWNSAADDKAFADL
jgi:AbrB family looped-hinge helix DNA binding protein